MEGEFAKYVCQEHQWNKRFCCINVNIVGVRSQVCKVSAGSEMLQGDSILGLESISVSGVYILTLYDSGSSHQILDKSCRHLCKNIKKIKVRLSAVDQSKFIWSESGVLSMTIFTQGSTKQAEVEVYLMDLNTDKYRSIRIKTPKKSGV